MSRERTNCNPKVNLIPEGTHKFTVVGEVKKLFGGPNKDMEFFVWTLEYPGGIGEQALMPSMQAPLLRLLGAEEYEPNKFDWDTTDQALKSFVATVTHAPDKKDSTKIRSHMGDFKAFSDDIPF